MSFNRSKKKMFDFCNVSKKSKYEKFKFLKGERESGTVKKECTPFFILKSQTPLQMDVIFTVEETQQTK